MIYNVGKTIINHHPITMFIGGMFTIPSHGWFRLVLSTLSLTASMEIPRNNKDMTRKNVVVFFNDMFTKKIYVCMYLLYVIRSM
jgi:hypothetical protein